MLVVNTTDAWQCGDAFIRMGVLRLLGVPALAPKWYVNRCQVDVGGSKGAALSDVLVGRPQVYDIMLGASAFICAGTPEWVQRAEPWWDAATRYHVPVALVGVGTRQPLERVLAAKAEGLIAGVTVRDTVAEQLLRHRAGLDPRWFPCPATAAMPKAYRGEPKDIPLIITPRLQCGPNVPSRLYWAGVAAQHGERATVVAVHEPAEIAAAREMFGRQDIFYSSRPSDYLELYARAQVVLAGRLHAALPTVAAGGTAYLPMLAHKFEAAQRLALETDPFGPLDCFNPKEPPAELVQQDPTRFLERLDALNADHAAYWSERACAWY